jgi:hypothetical protein
MDAVILISSAHEGSDARIAKTLMKLETLTQAPRVVAEVRDVEFAHRLRRRATQQNSARVSVYSIQELRAMFMFQAVVVPSFDLVYAELMGPWGESLVQLEPRREPPLTGNCSFDALSDHLSLCGCVLLAVELCDDSSAHAHGGACRTSLYVAGSTDDGLVQLERLLSVWVVARDQSLAHD